MDIQTFAEAHGLEIEIKLRPKKYRSSERARYYASIPSAEMLGAGGVLVSKFGNGATEEEAVAAYGEAISEEVLVIDAMRPGRREIKVPILAPTRPAEEAP
jgi:hypothetical protein